MKALASVSAVLCCVAVAACGGSSPAPAQPAPPVAHTDGTGGMQHEHDFSPEVAAFHDMMAPKWHAAPGAQRTTDTCGAVAGFKEASGKIGAAPVPERAAAQAGSWHNAVADLNIALGGLESACAVDGQPDFQSAFQAVHDAFHRLIALVGHEEKPEGMHEGGMHDGMGHEHHEGMHHDSGH